MKEKAREAYERVMGERPERVQRLDRGYGHLSWVVTRRSGQHMVLRTGHRHPTLADLRTEVAATALAQGAGVPVAEIVQVSDTVDNPLGRPFFVQRWLPGTDAARWLAEVTDPGRIASFAARWGELTALLHSVTLFGFGEDVLEPLDADFASLCQRRVAEVTRRAHRARVVPKVTVEQVGARVLAELEQVSGTTRPRLVHRDLYLPNVIVGPEAISIIDFESAAAYDNSWEFVKLQNWVFRRHPVLAVPFMAGYRSVAGDDGDLDARIRIAQGIEILSGIAYFGSEWPDKEMLDDFVRLLGSWSSGPLRTEAHR